MTGTTAITGRSDDFRHRHPADTVPQADCLLPALVTTICTGDAAQGQAAWGNFDMGLPGWQIGLKMEYARLTDFGTGMTEGALTAAEIDDGKPAGPAYQDLFFTAAEAGFAAAAEIDEFRFRYRPGRTKWRPFTAEVPAQKLCSADGLRHGDCSCHPRYLFPHGSH